MTLKNLALQQFRSYKKQSVSFSPAATLILGPNGAGKTNILEAIMLCATGKSFRAQVDLEMVKWDAAFGRVRANVDDTTLEIVLTSTKKYIVNGIARRQIDFVGNLRAVLFWPEDLALVTDSPSLRRKYLDSVLVQIDREYRRSLLSYERGLRQRNKLLDLIQEGKAHRHQLLFWNQLLIRTGGYITEKRQDYFDFVNTNKGYVIVYNKSVISESRLLQYKDEEVAAKATLVGPHRDDFAFEYNGRDVSAFGSRGEQRLAILWLKRQELSYIEKETGTRPLLLLDDIFSELDGEHRKLVSGMLEDQQTILTSADSDIMKLIPKGVEVINL